MTFPTEWKVIKFHGSSHLQPVRPWIFRWNPLVKSQVFKPHFGADSDGRPPVQAVCQRIDKDTASRPNVHFLLRWSYHWDCHCALRCQVWMGNFVQQRISLGCLDDLDISWQRRSKCGVPFRTYFMVMFKQFRAPLSPVAQCGAGFVGSSPVKLLMLTNRNPSSSRYTNSRSSKWP